MSPPAHHPGFIAFDSTARVLPFHACSLTESPARGTTHRSEMWGVPGASETVIGNYTSTFYGMAATAVKAVDESLRIGGPA